MLGLSERTPDIRGGIMRHIFTAAAIEERTIEGGDHSVLLTRAAFAMLAALNAACAIFVLALD